MARGGRERPRRIPNHWGRDKIPASAPHSLSLFVHQPFVCTRDAMACCIIRQSVITALPPACMYVSASLPAPISSLQCNMSYKMYIACLVSRHVCKSIDHRPITRAFPSVVIIFNAFYAICSGSVKCTC